MINPKVSVAGQAWKRLEHEHPNSLWQIDFKGHFETADGRCNPLTLLDVHSRFNLAIAVWTITDTLTVKKIKSNLSMKNTITSED